MGYLGFSSTLSMEYLLHARLRAWQGRGREGWAIVDCLMNLPMLYWATDVTGDPRYKLMAMKHADTAMKAFIRPDGSSNHIVIFDPNTGEELMKIELPVKHVTCCCFGGKDLDELYITTSGIDAPEDEYPLAGSIFVVKCGIKGRKVDRFKV